MAGVPITVTVPQPLAAAIDGEAHRRLVRRGDVIRDCLLQVWPAYVATVLADDLRPILDAEVAGDDSPPDAERPRLTTGACSDTLTDATVEPDVTGSGLDHEDAPGGVGG